ncbi:MAG: DUF885 domain-containing protein [Steroidobacteraceae bacterium]
MRIDRSAALLCLAGLACFALCLPAGAAPQSTGSRSAARGVAALHALFDREWQREEREDPVDASLRGDRTYDDRWPDRSLTAIDASHQADLAALAALARIDRAALPAAEQLNDDLFQWNYRDRVASWGFHEYLFPLNQLDGIQTSGDLTQSLRFATLHDYEDWLGRLERFGVYMDQTLALLEEGVKEHRTLPRVIVERIVPQIDANIVSDPEQSTFYAPLRKLPASIDSATARQLQARARAAVSSVVIPAFRRMQRFFAATYLPHARAALAVTTLPDGKAYYAYLVHHFTTTSMSPAEVHALGVERMKQLHDQMLAAVKDAGFHGTLKEFLHYLRTDPRFHYDDPARLLEAYKAEAKTIDPLLVKEFGHLPRIPWGVRPIPADQAPNTYPAYSDEPAADGSRAAYMSVNLYKPETRPIYEIPVLTCHEGRPGHALQLSLAVEMRDLPAFRRFTYYNAYGEGWALYTETLCGEMGLYDNPYKRFGALSYQMWRAVRLVVDTGIHEYGMTRAQAVALLKENTALTDQNIGTEVDRYIAWPGQALSYMVGEIEIQRLRAEAEHRLGSRFDIRQFHDVILGSGSLPLAVLAQQVEGWIAQTESAPPPPP